MSKIKLFLKFFNPHFRKKVKHVKSVIDCFLNVTLKILVYEIYIFFNINYFMWIVGIRGEQRNLSVGALKPKILLIQEAGKGGG